MFFTYMLNYFRSGSKDNKEYYKLGDMLFFLKNESKKHAEYVKSAAEARCGIITKPHRTQLSRYLKSEIGESSCSKTTIQDVVCYLY